MTNQEFELAAINPLDGRYRKQLAKASHWLSESSLIRARIEVELRWLLFLANEPSFKADLNISQPVKKALEQLASDVPLSAAMRVKDLEKTTNHDVKAVEYLLREELDRLGAPQSAHAFIHFACTSEDINNLSYGLLLTRSLKDLLLPQMQSLVDLIDHNVRCYQNLGMLSRTHGQSASPTTLGKELAVFGHRLRRPLSELAEFHFLGKLNGAVGNYNAHLSAYPDLDWPTLSARFVTSLGLQMNPLTTQIENHDSMIEFFDFIRRFNVILLGFCRDMWSYISIGYFKQQSKAGEVGSSTMPHKVNPIDFENAEGNLGVAVSLLQHFAEKLPISRWQRDLSDSTVQRVIGTALGHSLLAYSSCQRGLSKVSANEDLISNDLNQAWEVLAEPIQTVMRRFGVVDAYERLKNITRGHAVDRASLQSFIASVSELPNAEKERLLNLSPATYTGLAAKLAEDYLNQATK